MRSFFIRRWIGVEWNFYSYSAPSCVCSSFTSIICISLYSLISFSIPEWVLVNAQCSGGFNLEGKMYAVSSYSCSANNFIYREGCYITVQCKMSEYGGNRQWRSYWYSFLSLRLLLHGQRVRSEWATSYLFGRKMEGQWTWTGDYMQTGMCGEERERGE